MSSPILTAPQYSNLLTRYKAGETHARKLLVEHDDALRRDLKAARRSFRNPPHAASCATNSTFIFDAKPVCDCFKSKRRRSAA